MIRASILAAVAALAISPSLVHAQPKQAPPVAQVQIDTKGWALLGEQTVQGKPANDLILVGKYEGKVDQLQLVVLDSDIELEDPTVYFANDEKSSPAVKASFKKGQRSKMMDLPGN